jgi:flagellin-like hook-associated protein FlgL
MLITPKISNDAAMTGAQSDPAIHPGSHARRNSESRTSTSAQDAAASAVPNSLESQNNVSDAVASNDADSSRNISDSNAADVFMTSLRAGILAQPAATMLAQANLPPQSVYDLLQ